MCVPFVVPIIVFPSLVLLCVGSNDSQLTFFIIPFIEVISFTLFLVPSLQCQGGYDMRIVAADEGPVHAAVWSPSTIEFAVCYSKVPATVSVLCLVPLLLSVCSICSFCFFASALSIHLGFLVYFIGCLFRWPVLRVGFYESFVFLCAIQCEKLVSIMNRHVYKTDLFIRISIRMCCFTLVSARSLILIDVLFASAQLTASFEPPTVSHSRQFHPD